MARGNLTKADMKHLPAHNGDPFKEAAAYYTELVFTGTKKKDALKEAFPDKYDNAIKKAAGNKNLIAPNLAKAVAMVERAKFVQDCFNQANKHWWMKFMTKKQNVFEKLYKDALDEDLDTRDRHNAAKIFLAHIPDAPKEEKITVEVKVGSDEFKAQLAEKKRAIHSIANETIEDAEVIEDE